MPYHVPWELPYVTARHVLQWLTCNLQTFPNSFTHAAPLSFSVLKPILPSQFNGYRCNAKYLHTQLRKRVTSQVHMRESANSLYSLFSQCWWSLIQIDLMKPVLSNTFMDGFDPSKHRSEKPSRVTILNMMAIADSRKVESISLCIGYCRSDWANPAVDWNMGVNVNSKLV